MNKTIKRPDKNPSDTDSSKHVHEQSDSMDTIRDLLFGAEQKQNDARFTALSSELNRLEELLIAQAQEHRAQLQSLEAKWQQGKQQDLNEMGEAILAIGHSIKRLSVAE